jgi:hypothetical protein
MVKMMAATAVLLILVGCEQQYRYPCHNPDNWDTPRCQKPLCEINRDCPEHILKGTNGNGNGNGIVNYTNTPSNNCSQCVPPASNTSNAGATNNSFVRSNQQGAK